MAPSATTLPVEGRPGLREDGESCETMLRQLRDCSRRDGLCSPTPHRPGSTQPPPRDWPSQLRRPPRRGWGITLAARPARVDSHDDRGEDQNRAEHSATTGTRGGGMGWNGVVSPSALERSNGLKLEVVLDCEATRWMMTVVPAGICPSGSSVSCSGDQVPEAGITKTRDAMIAPYRRTRQRRWRECGGVDRKTGV